ncbi:MAG: hypothetical protein KGZ92_04605 [Firmicutes bacterium]|nr:hypothetical protein [Dethiobacter sp.]MBS3888566.1 hypothetical protein [Bacillota bacterium]MBS4054130.1 hypothetical protein [Thermaerobacter sp.]
MDRKVDTTRERKFAAFCDYLERIRFNDYVDMTNNPWRLLWVNFIAGAARGVGFAFGGSLLAAFLVYLLSQIAILNLPLISEFIAEIVRLVSKNLEP